MEMLWVVSFLMCLWAAESTVYFKEQFDDGDGYLSRWVSSTSKGGDQGKFVISSGKFYGDVEKDKGLQTSQDARFYGISAKFDSFSNEGKSLVIQFSVKHEQNIDCGGGYVKVFPSTLDQTGMHGDSPYHIMFGPDICGSGTKKVHVIFTHAGKNHLIKKEIRCKDDEFTHLYTLIVKPDNTYEVKIDNSKVESGSLEEDWDILPPREILDPDAKKPEDWDDNESIPDPTDEKPEDWDKPEHIPDPEAKKPEDWDDEMDGEWEAAMIDNPEYKGEWKPKQIPNPAYKGKWVHPKIPNPDFHEEPHLYRYTDIGALGFDLWQTNRWTQTLLPRPRPVLAPTRLLQAPASPTADPSWSYHRQHPGAQLRALSAVLRLPLARPPPAPRLIRRLRTRELLRQRGGAWKVLTKQKRQRGAANSRRRSLLLSPAGLPAADSF